MQVKQFLSERNIPFEVLAHPAAYSASRLAHALHVEGKLVAKTILIHANQGYADLLAVVPADCRVDLPKLSQALGGAELELATERDLERYCPDCETGVVPPFGSQYGLQTVVDERLAADEEIVFEGNTHEEAIRMRFADYRRIEGPLIAPIAVREGPR